MRKVKLSVVMFLALIVLVGLSACASDTPWRKATVTSYELVGVGIGATKDTAEALQAQNLISAEQISKIKDAYNKARNVYVAAGNALKLAGKAESAASRDVLLAEYDKLLTDFRALAYQLYDLVKGFKKVSYNDVLESVKSGGEIWVQ